MLKERVKSLALFLLFALSIYLMKELWASDLILTLNSNSQGKTQIQDTAFVITPQSMTYSFGSGAYSAVFFDAYETWAIIQGQLEKALEKPMKIEEIDSALYTQKKEGRSIEFDFNYTLTLGNLVDIYQLNVNKEASDSQTFDRLLISSGQVNTLYLCSGTKFYLLILDIPKFSIDQEIIEAESQETARYRSVESVYKIKSILDNKKGEFRVNRQIIPLGSIESAYSLQVRSEYDIEDDGVLRSLVSQFFGNHIVKKLVDIDGSLVYLYGYGEKALKVSENGSIEFKSKLQNASFKAVSLNKALQLSLSFIDRFGGLPEGLRLKSYTYKTESETPVYTLFFSQSISGLMVEGEEDEIGIHITLMGEQVTEYTRYIMLADENNIPEGSLHSIQTIDSLINQNFVTAISPNYINDHPPATGIDSQEYSPQHIFDVLQSINGFETLYYFDTLKSGRLVPVWKIGFDKYLYYFDLSDGQILKTERKAE